MARLRILLVFLRVTLFGGGEAYSDVENRETNSVGEQPKRALKLLVKDAWSLKPTR